MRKAELQELASQIGASPEGLKADILASIERLRGSLEVPHHPSSLAESADSSCIRSPAAAHEHSQATQQQPGTGSRGTPSNVELTAAGHKDTQAGPKQQGNVSRAASSSADSRRAASAQNAEHTLESIAMRAAPESSDSTAVSSGENAEEIASTPSLRSHSAQEGGSTQMGSSSGSSRSPRGNTKAVIDRGHGAQRIGRGLAEGAVDRRRGAQTSGSLQQERGGGPDAMLDLLEELSDEEVEADRVEGSTPSHSTVRAGLLRCLRDCA
jgi:hypothetical protein